MQFGIYSHIYKTINHELIATSTKHRPQVYKVRWYMCHYGGSSPKPEVGFTNNRYCNLLDKGKLDRKMFAGKPKVETVRKTISKSGKTQYTGTKALKETQPQPYLLNMQFKFHDFRYMANQIPFQFMNHAIQHRQELSTAVWGSYPGALSKIDHWC